jgi:hypothetical protein
VLGDRVDQVLLRGEVVVQRRVVDADVLGDLAQPQTLEPGFGHPRERRQHQLLATPRRLPTNHLVDTSAVAGGRATRGRMRRCARS